MEIDLIFRVAGVGIIVAVISQLLKASERSEQAMMVTIAGLIAVLLMIIREIDTLFDTIKTTFLL